jgi:hypothetical protein
VTSLVLVVIGLVGCTPSATPTPSIGLGTPSGSPFPAATATAAATATPSVGAASSPDDAPDGSGSQGSVVRDDSLLTVLVPDLDGNAVTAEEASFGEAASDPAFSEHVARAAFAVVSSPNDLASGVVAELKPGLLDDAFFTDWRETYDEGACSQAGGVATNAETKLGGRTVWITTCGGGLSVYHAEIPERNLVVSLFSLGEGRYGERLMRDLRP